MTGTNRITIFDTTLRDGEQSPGAAMTLEEKLQVAELLDEMGVDVIEAGFPIASNGDFEAVRKSPSSSSARSSAVWRAQASKDIDRAGEAIKHAKRAASTRSFRPVPCI
jgi:2-isopropylmalate synthase